VPGESEGARAVHDRHDRRTGFEFVSGHHAVGALGSIGSADAVVAVFPRAPKAFAPVIARARFAGAVVVAGAQGVSALALRAFRLTWSYSKSYTLSAPAPLATIAVNARCPASDGVLTP
jgi:hypothetical protein